MSPKPPIDHKPTGNEKCASCQANEGDVGILFTRKTLVCTNEIKNQLKTKEKFTIIENGNLDSNKDIFINRIYSPLGLPASERFNSIEVYNSYRYSDQNSNTKDDYFKIHPDLDKNIRFMKTTLRKGYLYIYLPNTKKIICYRISDNAIVNKIDNTITNVNQILEMEKKSTCSSCKAFSMNKIIIFLTKSQYNNGDFYFKFSDCYLSEETLNFYKDEKNIQNNMSHYKTLSPQSLKNTLTSVLDFNPIRYTWYDNQWYDFKNNKYLTTISDKNAIENRPKVIDKLLQHNVTVSLLQHFNNNSEFSHLVYAAKSPNTNLNEILKAHILNNIPENIKSLPLYEVCVDDRTGFMLDLASHSEYLYQNEFKDKVHPKYLAYPLLDKIEDVASDVELFKYFSELHSAVYTKAKIKAPYSKFKKDILISEEDDSIYKEEEEFLKALKTDFITQVPTPQSITVNKCSEQISLLLPPSIQKKQRLNDIISSNTSNLTSRILKLYFSNVEVDDMKIRRESIKKNLDLTKYNYLEHKIHTYLFANSFTEDDQLNLKKKSSYDNSNPKKYYSIHFASENMIENELFSKKFYFQLNSIFNFTNKNKSKTTIQLLNESLFSSVIRHIISKFSPRSSITKGIRNYLNISNNDNAQKNNTSLNRGNKQNHDIIEKFKEKGYLCNMLAGSNGSASSDEKMIKFTEKNIFIYAFLTCQAQLIENFITISRDIKQNPSIKKIQPQNKKNLQSEIATLTNNIKNKIKIHKSIKENSITWKNIMHFYLLVPPNNLIWLEEKTQEVLTAYDLLSYAFTSKVTVELPKAGTHNEYAVKIAITEEEFIKNSGLDETLNTILNNRGLPLLQDIIPKLSDFISCMTCISLINDAFKKQELSEDSFVAISTKLITSFKTITNNDINFTEVNSSRSLDIRLNLVSGIVYHTGSVLLSTNLENTTSRVNVYKSALIIAINFGLLFIKHPLAQLGLSILYSLVDTLFKNNDMSLPTQITNIIQKFRSFGNDSEFNDYYEFISMFKKLHNTHNHFRSLTINKSIIEAYELIGISSKKPYTLEYFFDTYTEILSDSPTYAPKSGKFLKIDSEHLRAQRYIIFKDILEAIMNLSDNPPSNNGLRLNESPAPIK